MKPATCTTAVVTVAVLSLGLAGCAGSSDDDASGQNSPSTAASSGAAPVRSIDFKACMASDSAGFEDYSVNQASFAGLLAAQTDQGVEIGHLVSGSDSRSGYTDSLNALVSQGCNAVIAVGADMGRATQSAAKTNPEVEFSIVDHAYDKPSANLRGLVFDTAQPAFLAGFLAAAQSESGVVGTFGGTDISTVTTAMEGFKQGVERFNDDNDAAVEVVGWNGKDGSFVGDFDDEAEGRSIAEGMISEGADVIMPVAGQAGVGGLEAVKEADIRAVWVDTDGCESVARYCDVLLTSVVKGMGTAVEETIRTSVDGTFSNETYTGTLANGGVRLAPYHESDDDISDDVKAQVLDLWSQVVDGSLTVG